jgi:hypothetical protein
VNFTSLLCAESAGNPWQLYSAVFLALAAALIGSRLLSPMAGNMAYTLVFPAIASAEPPFRGVESISQFFGTSASAVRNSFGVT